MNNFKISHRTLNIIENHTQRNVNMRYMSKNFNTVSFYETTITLNSIYDDLVIKDFINYYNNMKRETVLITTCGKSYCDTYYQFEKFYISRYELNGFGDDNTNYNITFHIDCDYITTLLDNDKSLKSIRRQKIIEKLLKESS